jgi:hypothetical protein
MTGPEMLALTQREFEALDALVARLAPADWSRPVPRPETRDPWTVKDAVAHVVYWKQSTARYIRGERRPPEDKGLNGTDLNHKVYLRWRRRSPKDVVAWHHEVHEEVLAALKARPESYFSGRHRKPGWLGDLHSHSAGHRRRDIEAALQT